MIKSIISYLSVVILHISLVYFKVLGGDFPNSILVDFIIVSLFLFAALIGFSGIKKGGESFTQRFLIITTVQMLAMFTLIFTIFFQKIEHVKIIAFSAIGLFVILLGLQAYFFISGMRKNVKIND
jgi:hypothetical protein